MTRHIGYARVRKTDSPHCHKPDYRGEFTNTKHMTQKGAVHSRPVAKNYITTRDASETNHQRVVRQRQERQARERISRSIARPVTRF